MNTNSKRIQRVGYVLIVLVALVLILAGICKILDVGAEDMLEGLEKAGLSEYRTLISLTSLFCGVLLLIPAVRNFGLLMASAYWGGAIVCHLTYDDSVLMPASFLGVLWIGAAMCAASDSRLATGDDTKSCNS